MVIDSLETIKHHVGIEKYLRDSIEQVLTMGLFSLPLGDYLLGNGKIIVKIMDRELLSPSEKRYEVHQDYIDLHIPLSGFEAIGYVNKEGRMTNITPFDLGNDIGFSEPSEKNIETWINIPPGGVAIFYPGEWHKPACTLSVGAMLRKAVVKIKVE